MKMFIKGTLCFFALCFQALPSLASPSWVKPIEGADANEKLDFWTGFSLFRSPWVAAPSSTTGRDGLGPLFNARSCDACHKNGSAGKMPEDGFGLILRLSSGNGQKTGPQALVNYGGQLQTLSIDSITGGDQVPAEAKLQITWEKFLAETGAELKRPQAKLDALAYGDEVSSAHASLRLAPPLFGLGLIDDIPVQGILHREDENDENNDGISGRANRVLNRETGKLDVGRFGYKSEQPNLRQQVAAAFNEDVGLSSWLYPNQICTLIQTACLHMANGNSPEEGVEISREKLEKVTAFSALLRSPYADENLQNSRGHKIFVSVGCASCHVPTLDNKNLIFSDLLLHDMGEGLADGRAVYRASSSEWRTTPLWGLSRKMLSQPATLLHDGRAGSVEEAILWHDGEAKTARNAYLVLPDDEKKELEKFLHTL